MATVSETVTTSTDTGTDPEAVVSTAAEDDAAEGGLETVAALPPRPTEQAPHVAALPPRPTGGRPSGDRIPFVADTDGRLRPEWATRSAVVRDYFDTEWGRAVRDERGLFELVVLLVFAGGLTFSHVLSCRDALRAGFAGFDPDAVARFDDAAIERLLDDPTMIRNRRKISAAITNARAVVALREHGGLAALVWDDGADETTDDADEAPIETTAAGIPRRTRRSTALADRLHEAGFTHIGPVMAHSLLLASGAAPATFPAPAASAADGDV
ncbi:MAG: DNA-3-methyladenine glycosylase I [Mobilicoccus sp.]|nr:DNA-3-methyladenine glycosylase I [Mobilicoccus sp.]